MKVEGGYRNTPFHPSPSKIYMCWRRIWTAWRLLVNYWCLLHFSFSDFLECHILCEHGFDTDADGYRLCECLPQAAEAWSPWSCGELECRNYCPDGRKKGVVLYCKPLCIGGFLIWWDFTCRTYWLLFKLPGFWWHSLWASLGQYALDGI